MRKVKSLQRENAHRVLALDDSAGVSLAAGRSKGGRDAARYSVTIAMAFETIPAFEGSLGKKEKP